MSPGMIQSQGSATRTGHNQTQFRTDNAYTHSGGVSAGKANETIQQHSGRSNFRISRESDIGVESSLEQNRAQKQNDFNTSQPSPTRAFAGKKGSESKQKQVPITQFPT